MIKFSANLSMLFTERSLIERFKVAKVCGFEAVEIQFPYESPAEAILEQLKQQHLKLVLFNVGADDLLQGGEGLAAVPEKQEKFAEALEQAIEYAKILKPEFINVLPGCCYDRSRTDNYQQTLIDNLKRAINSFSPLGIKTVFEAVNTFDMPGFLIHSGQQMLTVLAEINHSNLYMQYDIYHMSRMGENVSQFIWDNVDKIGHIQFADCPGRGQPASGQVDFKSIFYVIDHSGYKGWVGAEYHPGGITEESLSWFKLS